MGLMCMLVLSATRYTTQTGNIMTFPKVFTEKNPRYTVLLSLTGGRTWLRPASGTTNDLAQAQKVYDHYNNLPVSAFVSTDRDPWLPLPEVSVKLVDAKTEIAGPDRDLATKTELLFNRLSQELWADGASDRAIIQKSLLKKGMTRRYWKVGY